MSWSSVIPLWLLAVGWIVGPGLLVGWAAGLRGLVVWGAAPLLSVGLVAGSAVLAGAMDIRWQWLVPVMAVVVAAMAVGGYRAAHGGLGVQFTGRRRRPRLSWVVALARIHGRWRVPRLDGGTGAAGVAGSVAAAVLGGVTVAAGMGRPDALSQTFDANFHYNAVVRILDSGNASSMVLGTLTNPSSAAAFYPGAWHDLVSLVTLATGNGGVVTASNAVVFAVSAVMWPLSCLLLIRQVVGRSLGAALAAPVLALGFVAFPWTLIAYGALWPNLLGVALMPAALAAVVTCVGWARASTVSRGGALMLALTAVPTLGLAHPNAVFGLAVVAVWPLAWSLGGVIRDRWRARRRFVAVVAILAAVTTVAGVSWVMAASPLLAGVRSYSWDPIGTWQQGVVGVLTNSPNGGPAAWTISFLVLSGAVAALRHWRTSWLIPTHASTSALYVVAASTSSSPWTGAWYNDPPRLAAMVPVTAAPLAVIGLVAITGLVLRAPSLLRQVRWPRSPHAGVPVALVLLLLLVVSGGLYQRPHAHYLATIYRNPTDVLVDSDQREFLIRAGAVLPHDAVVAQNPFTGNALLYALTNRHVLFPHLQGSWSPEQQVIAQRLPEAGTDPSVCTAIEATGVTYALTGPATFWPWNPLASNFGGLDDLSETAGFNLIADDGNSRLYRITACGQSEPSGS